MYKYYIIKESPNYIILNSGDVSRSVTTTEPVNSTDHK